MNDAGLPAPPLLIALAAAAGSGKDTVGLHLKRRHGFARTSFALPLYEALSSLYGITAFDTTGDREQPIARLGKSVRELIQDMGDHARSQVGHDILIRRLVERCTARGEWRQQDLVITDLRMESELEWLRMQGGRVVWIRRDQVKKVRPHATERVELLMVRHYRREDGVILNNDSIGELLDTVDGLVAQMRSEAEIAS